VTARFGIPARVAIAHSPRDTTFAPNPACPISRTVPATSFALTLYCRIHGSGNAAATSSTEARRVAASVT
jgi:hypothetical protein